MLSESERTSLCCTIGENVIRWNKASENSHGGKKCDEKE